MEFRRLLNAERREPTWAERERLQRLTVDGAEDVYLDIAEAPPEFWRSVLRATHTYLASRTSRLFDTWLTEFLYAMDLPDTNFGGHRMYESIVLRGRLAGSSFKFTRISLGQRLSAVEHLLDLTPSSDADDFSVAITDKARWLRVGVAISGRRFVPLSNELMHEKVVQPTLSLLSTARYSQVDALYRKSFDRYFAHDPAGAITAATSSVEECLRILLDTSGSQLQKLLVQARKAKLIIPAAEQMAVKLAALRDESDAHTAGTDDPVVAMFAIHTAGAILLYLDSAEAAAST